MASRRARLLAVVAGACVAITATEVAFRITRLEQRWLSTLLLDVSDGMHRISDDPELLYELIPGAHVEGPVLRSWGTEQLVIRINSLGFRDHPRTADKSPDTLRIVCLGGSNTYGDSATQELTWPAQLEEELRGRCIRPVEVWNCGVQGYVNRQKAALGEHALDQFAPDLFLIQVNNIGRRPVVLDQGLEPNLRRFPSLYDENLVGAPSPDNRLPWLLWQSCATWRTSTIAFNSFCYWKPLGGTSSLTGGRANVENSAALLRFMIHAVEHAGIFVVHPACGGPPLSFSDAHPDYGFIDLQERLPEAWRDQEEYNDIHPSGRAYGWYAREIADTLVEAGCLTNPIGCTL